MNFKLFVRLRLWLENEFWQSLMKSLLQGVFGKKDNFSWRSSFKSAIFVLAWARKTIWNEGTAFEVFISSLKHQKSLT